MPKSLIPGHIRHYTDRGDCNNAIKYQINAMHRHVQKSIFVTSNRKINSMENTGRAIIATMGWGDFRAFAIVYATSATFIAVKTRKMKDFFV